METSGWNGTITGMGMMVDQAWEEAGISISARQISAPILGMIHFPVYSWVRLALVIELPGCYDLSPGNGTNVAL